MQILYVPRSDAHIISGGDVEYARLLGDHLSQLGVGLMFASFDELQSISSVDAVFLTQIYQIDVAEKVAEWASRRNKPLLISPLFEEGLRLGYRYAQQGRGKWYQLTRLIGSTLAEIIFLLRENSLRTRSNLWQRQRRLLQQVYLLPNTRYELNHLCHWFKLDNPSAAIIPLGIDPSHFNKNIGGQLNNLPENVRSWQGSYVMQVGLISSRKNQVSLLKALYNEDVPIVFVGRQSPYEPDYYNRLKAMAERRGNVQFFERVSIESLAALYGHSAVHALPSWSERPGLVSLEAAACGTSVVASDSAPIWEYLDNGIHLCKPQNETSIRKAVHAALSQGSPDIADRVCERYTWERTAWQFKSVLESVLNNQRHNHHAHPVPD
jgi:glycosyltransferase involved in cell wall biosynthesis